MGQTFSDLYSRISQSQEQTTARDYSKTGTNLDTGYNYIDHHFNDTGYNHIDDHFNDGQVSLNRSSESSDSGNAFQKSLCCFLVFVFILGFVGNVLILGIIAIQKKERTISSYFVASLALTDLILLLTCGILYIIVIAELTFEVEPTEFPASLVTFLAFLHEVGKGVACLMLVALTIDRYLAMVQPLSSLWFRTVKNALRASAGIWTGSIIFALVLLKLEQVIDILAMYVFIIIIEYIIPLTVNIICYIFIIRTVWRALGRGSPEELGRISLESQSRRQKHALVRMVFAAVVVFAVGFGVHHSIVLYLHIAKRHNAISEFGEWVLGAEIALFVTSALNPFVYGLTNSTFSASLKSMLCCKKRASQIRDMRMIMAEYQ